MRDKILQYREQFISLPGPLKKQILTRLGFAVSFALLSALILISMFDWMALIPVVFLMIYSIISAIQLFFRASAGAYVVIRGQCVDVTTAPIRKRSKSILVQTDTHMVRLMMKQRPKRIPVGVMLEIYVANSTQVYEKDGAKLLHTYLAINIVAQENQGK